MAETTPPAPSLQGKTPDLPQIVGDIVRWAINDVARGLEEPSEASRAASVALKTHIATAIRDAEAAARRDALEEAAREVVLGAKEAADVYPHEKRGVVALQANVLKRLHALASSPAPAKRAETEESP